MSLYPAGQHCALASRALGPGAWLIPGFPQLTPAAPALAVRGSVLETGAYLSGKRVAVANGRRDPMATPALTQTLADQLRARGAAVTVLSHPGGHTIDPHQPPRLAAFLTEGARHG
ncbi:MAG: phospholipase/carboxylesterase [Pseudonocardiales bacterium]|nr:phospholipase/carboxylesterase [Pseudonocardiales bacterium]